MTKQKRVKRKTTVAKKKKNKKNKTDSQIRTERKHRALRKPANLNYWKFVIQKPKEVQQFVDRGSDRQKDSLKRVLNYIKKVDKEEFDKVGGKGWLKKLKD